MTTDVLAHYVPDPLSKHDIDSAQYAYSCSPASDSQQTSKFGEIMWTANIVLRKIKRDNG